MYGRHKPYTQIGVRRLPCIRYSICGNKATFVWSICSDDSLNRPICQSCDEELNEMILRWAGFSDWQEKMERYKNI